MVEFAVVTIRDEGWLEEECNDKRAVIPEHLSKGERCLGSRNLIVETQANNLFSSGVAWVRCQFCQQDFRGKAF